ncbi:MAG: glycosyl hydrolase family 28-related protein [Bryobacteraceae bacterium]
MRTLSLLLSAWWIAPAAFASVDCQAGSSAPPSQSNTCYCASTACGGCPQTSNASLSGSATDPHSVNVADFGARGDGAADDTAAIVRALAAGTVVVFPRLTYVVTGIWVPSNRTLLFDGTTIKLAAGSNAYAFTLTGATNVRFAGVLKIDGNKSAQTLPQGGGMILSAASSANCFEYVEVVNPMEYGVAISASNENTFGSLKVTDPGGAGIALNYQGAYLYLGGAADNKFYAIYGEGAAGNGVHLDSSTRNQFGLLELRSGGGKGLALGHNSTYNSFTESFLESNGDNGAFLEAGSGHNRFRLIRAQSNTGNGLECNSDYNSFESVVATGSVDGGIGGVGVYLGGSCNALSSVVAAANERDGVRVASGEGNTLSLVTVNNSQREANVSDGLRFLEGATGNVVKSVVATDTQAVKTQRYGVSNSAAATVNVVAMAYLEGNATGPYISSGNDVVEQRSGSVEVTLPQLLILAGLPAPGDCAAGCDSFLPSRPCVPVPPPTQ